MNRTTRSMHWKKWGMILSMMAALCSAVRAADAAPKPEGLVGYWKLNEGSGAMVQDSSGNEAQGEIVGTAKWDSGQSGPVLSFDGETTMVKIPDGEWNNEDPVTLMCWVNPERENNGRVFDHMASGVIVGSYSLTASGSFGGFGGEEIDYANLKSKGVSMRLLPDEWNFVAIVIDRKELRGYLDGELANSIEIDGWPRVAGALTLGARQLTEKNDNFFKGQIREMAVFNRALTAEEIAAIYTAYSQGQSLCPPPAGLKSQPVRR